MRIYTLLSICAILFLFSCKKDPNSILGDDLSGNRNIDEYYTDTLFKITAFTVPDDSLIIQNYTTFLLGTTKSDAFGTSTYNLVTQLSYNLWLSKLTVTNEKIQTVDSVILTIPYSYSYPLAENSNFFGRDLTLEIYEVSEDIDTTTQSDGYYTIQSKVAYQSTPIHTQTITLNPPQSSSDTNVGHSIKIRNIDHAFGLRLVKLLEQSFDTSSDENFEKLFKGLYFKIVPATSPEQSMVASFKTDVYNGTELSVYFNSTASDTARASSRYSFAIGKHFTQVIKDRSGSHIENVFGDSIAGKDKLYIESVGGSRVRLSFPNLRALLDDTTYAYAAINRAALVFTIADTSSGGVRMPSNTYLYKYIDNKTIEYIMDYNVGGTYDATRGEYRLYITRWMQDLMYNKDKEIPYLDLSAVPNIRFQIPTQAVLNGSDKIRLEVLYSTIQK